MVVAQALILGQESLATWVTSPFRYHLLFDAPRLLVHGLAATPNFLGSPRHGAPPTTQHCRRIANPCHHWETEHGREPLLCRDVVTYACIKRLTSLTHVELSTEIPPQNRLLRYRPLHSLSR